MDYVRRIKLFNKDYVLVGTLENGGPIATENQYANFDCSYAHLFPDGKIRRFGRQIGSKEDITLLPFQVKIIPEASFDKVLSSILNPYRWANKKPQDGKS